MYQFMKKLENIATKATKKQIQYVEELYKDIYHENKNFSGYSKKDVSTIIDILKNLRVEIKKTHKSIKLIERGGE